MALSPSLVNLHDLPALPPRGCGRFRWKAVTQLCPLRPALRDTS